MHLPGQADGPHRADRRRRAFAQAVHRKIERSPPVVRVLLAPLRLRARDGQRRIGGRHDAMLVVEQQHLDTRGAEIDAEVHGAKRNQCLMPKRLSPWRRYSRGVMPLMSRKRRVKLSTVLNPTT